MSDLAENTTTVSIYGEKYSIRGKADSGFIEKVADYVDSKMQEVGANISSASAPHRIAILAALNIAGELFQTIDDRTDILEKLTKKSEDLISAIDETLSEG